MSETGMGIDRRSKRGRELAARLNRETVLKNMPRLYYVEDFGMDRYRVGRSDWSGDMFELVPRKEFEVVLKVLNSLHYPIDDLTYAD